MLAPRLVSHDDVLALPPVRHEPLQLPSHLRRSGRPSPATQDALERQHAAFERNHTDLYEIVAGLKPAALPNITDDPSPAPQQERTTAPQPLLATMPPEASSSKPLHGPKPNPPERATDARGRTATNEPLGASSSKPLHGPRPDPVERS